MKKEKKTKDVMNSIIHDGQVTVVADVEIQVASPGDAGFNILVDDVLHGPFQKIKIRPLMDKDKSGRETHVHVPIMSFLPLNAMM